MQRIQAFWNDDAGLVLSAELVFVTSIAAIGMVVGLSAARDGVTSELADVGKAINSYNQGFRIEGIRGHGASSAGSLFSDNSDFCETAAQDVANTDEACIVRVAADAATEAIAPSIPTP